MEAKPSNGHLKWGAPGLVHHYTRAQYANHIARSPRVINYIVFGWLSVTVVALPDVELTEAQGAKHYHLAWNVKATCHSEQRGDDNEVDVFGLWSRPLGGYPVEWDMKRAARACARQYVDSGRGVRGHAYVRWPIHRLINAGLGASKPELGALRKRGYLGSAEEKSTEWLR